MRADNDIMKRTSPLAVVGFRLAALVVGFGTALWSGAAELVVDVFSGQPSPTLTLSEAEVAHVQQILGGATPAPPKDPSTVFPSLLGYRGVEIHHWETNQAAESLLRIRGPDILEISGTTQRWFRARDTSLEQHLVDLAHARGVLTDALHWTIRLDIEKRSPSTLFLDDFNGPALDPIWSSPLPSTSNTMPPVLMNYAGTPSYRLESLGADSVLRLGNLFAPSQRRGWATSTDFFATEFRCEVRFNTLDQSPSVSIGGFIELWILDAADSNRFDFVSLFGGSLDFAPVAFAAATSMGEDDRLTRVWTTGAMQTYYRLVLDGSRTRTMRALLLSDDGHEIFSHSFQHTTAAFNGGFRVGLSQGHGPLVTSDPVPTDVAVDFVRLTGTDAPSVSLEVAVVRICWDSLANRNYQVQYRSEVTTNHWVNLGEPVPGTGRRDCVTDAVTEPARYYRVVTVP